MWDEEGEKKGEMVRTHFFFSSFTFDQAIVEESGKERKKEEDGM